MLGFLIKGKDWWYVKFDVKVKVNNDNGYFKCQRVSLDNNTRQFTKEIKVKSNLLDNGPFILLGGGNEY
jgi:hypothetical protein